MQWLNPSTIVVLAMALYGMATVLQCRYWITQKHASMSVWFGAGIVGFFLQGYGLYHLIDIAGGQNLTYPIVFSLMTWVFSFFVLFGALFKPLVNLSVLAFPLSMLAILLTMLFPGQRVEQTGMDTETFVHIWFAILTTAVLLVTASQALLIAVLDYLLHHKRVIRLVQLLPPLQSMESMLFGMIWGGFILLSILLVSSQWFFHNAFHHTMLHKTLPGVLAWGIFLMLLIGRYGFGWRGRLAVRGTLLGVFILMAGYFSV